MPAYGKRSGQVPVWTSHVGVASKFADYAVSVLEGSTQDGEAVGEDRGIQQQTPMTAPRKVKSVQDALRWSAEAAVGTVARRAKRQKTDDSSQLHLDFGQRNFYNTRCRVCDMYYCPGLASDEKLHEDFHKRITHGIIYKGFKHQNVVGTFKDGSYIVCIRPNDPATHLAKAEEVYQIAQRELGGFEGGRSESSVTFLMISAERRCVGLVLAERILRAYRVVTSRLSDEAQVAAVAKKHDDDSVSAHASDLAELHVNANERFSAPEQDGNPASPSPSRECAAPGACDSQQQDSTADHTSPDAEDLAAADKHDADTECGALLGEGLQYVRSHMSCEHETTQSETFQTLAHEQEAAHSCTSDPIGAVVGVGLQEEEEGEEEEEEEEERRRTAGDTEAPWEDACAPSFGEQSALEKGHQGAECNVASGLAGMPIDASADSRAHVDATAGARGLPIDDSDDERRCASQDGDDRRIGHVDVASFELCRVGASARDTSDGCTDDENKEASAPAVAANTLAGSARAIAKADEDVTDDDDDLEGLDLDALEASALPDLTCSVVRAHQEVCMEADDRAQCSAPPQVSEGVEAPEAVAYVVHSSYSDVDGSQIECEGSCIDNDKEAEGSFHSLESPWVVAGAMDTDGPCAHAAVAAATPLVTGTFESEAGPAGFSVKRGGVDSGIHGTASGMVAASGRDANVVDDVDEGAPADEKGESGWQGGPGEDADVAEHGDEMHDNEDQESRADESLMVATEEEAAICGVCLIWVHKRHRRKGIASRLLRAVLQHSGFNHASVVPPSKVAFSQPTAAGRKLASSFLGTEHFLVYKGTD